MAVNHMQAQEVPPPRTQNPFRKSSADVFPAQRAQTLAELSKSKPPHQTVVFQATPRKQQQDPSQLGKRQNVDPDGPFQDYKAKLFGSIADQGTQSQTQRPTKKIQRFGKTRRQIAMAKLQFSTNSQASKSNMLEPMSDAASMRGNMNQLAQEDDDQDSVSGTSHNSDSEMMAFEDQPKEENAQASDAEMD